MPCPYRCTADNQPVLASSTSERYTLLRTMWGQTRTYFKNIDEKVSHSLPTDSMVVTSTPGVRVTSRVNGVPRTGS